MRKPPRIERPGGDPSSLSARKSELVRCRDLGAAALEDTACRKAWAESCVLLIWNRLIMPDGTSIVLERLQGADPQGFSGLEDGVDYHWGRLFRAAAFSTLLGIGTEVGSSNDENEIAKAIRESAQDTAADVGQQIVRRQLNIQPTLTIRPGFPVRVVVQRDLLMQPWGGCEGADMTKMKLFTIPDDKPVKITVERPAHVTMLARVN